MPRLRLRLVVLLAALVLVSSAAHATTVDFEDLSEGDAAANHYAGLTFSNATVLTAGSVLNEFELPPHSGANVIFDDGGAISISFATPIASFSGYVTYFDPLTLTAFDATNTPIGALTSAYGANAALSGDPGSSPNELLNFSSALGISSITIVGDPNGGSFVLDDVTVQALPTGAAVPEPGTLSLLALGAAGIARRRWWMSTRR